MVSGEPSRGCEKGSPENEKGETRPLADKVPRAHVHIHPHGHKRSKNTCTPAQAHMRAHTQPRMHNELAQNNVSKLDAGMFLKRTATIQSRKERKEAENKEERRCQLHPTMLLTFDNLM